MTLVLVLAGESVLSAQDGIVKLGPWVLRSVSGEVEAGTMYQEQKFLYNEDEDGINSLRFTGGIQLNTSSYLWRPDIFTISLNGIYHPETRDENYLTLPDRSEVRTLKKLDFRTTVFSNRKLSLTSWINLNQNYFNRESLTNIKSDNRQWGGLLNSGNTVLPFSIRFQKMSWDQKETESGRNFHTDQMSIHTKLSKSFSGTDKNEFSYTFDDYMYSYADQQTINNTVHHITLENTFILEKERKSGFRSYASIYQQDGSFSFKKGDINEQLTLHLPANLDWISTYNYYGLNDYSQVMNINRFRTSLRHLLYKSLTSELFSDYAITSHSIYNEKIFKGGGELSYTKNILVGKLELGYRYFLHHNSHVGPGGTTFIVNESLTVTDNAGNYLKKPFADPNSVVITDLTGGIRYEEGFDYLLDSLNNFLDIIRVPGGQIEEGQEVLISYMIHVPGSYSFLAGNHSFTAAISILDRLLRVYYRANSQHFNEMEEIAFLTLNTFNQHVFGTQIHYNFLTAGIELDNYQSSIIPYKRMNYYISISSRIRSRILLSLNFTYRDYKLLGTDTNQKYINTSGRISYTVSPITKLNFQLGYLNQQGRNIDLDLLTGKAELTTKFRKLYLNTGYILYNRSYLNSSFNYSRAFLTLTRKF